MVTLEGENYVMYQQAARYLVKCVAALKAGRSVDPPMEYFENYSLNAKCTAHGPSFLEPAIQLSIFRHRAVRMAFEAHQLLEDSAREGL
ncbi:hypothetical protein H0H93_005588, partial [Arthromyces matolae]